MADGLIYAIQKAIKENRFIDREYDNVFSVSSKTAIKLHDIESKAKREYEIWKELWKNQVRVPEFYELIHLDKMKVKKRKIEWIISMEKINGKKIIELDDAEKDEAVWQFKKEITKVIDIKILPRACFYTGNSLFDQEKQKLYLIDFEEWQKSDETPATKWNYLMFKNWFHHAITNGEKLPFYSETEVFHL